MNIPSISISMMTLAFSDVIAHREIHVLRREMSSTTQKKPNHAFKATLNFKLIIREGCKELTQEHEYVQQQFCSAEENLETLTKKRRETKASKSQLNTRCRTCQSRACGWGCRCSVWKSGENEIIFHSVIQSERRKSERELPALSWMLHNVISQD